MFIEPGEIVVIEQVVARLKLLASASPARAPIALKDIPHPPAALTLDWGNAGHAYCDYCGGWHGCAVEKDSTKICANCADESRLSDWQDYANGLRNMLVAIAKGDPIETRD